MDRKSVQVVLIVITATACVLLYREHERLEEAVEAEDYDEMEAILSTINAFEEVAATAQGVLEGLGFVLDTREFSPSAWIRRLRAASHLQEHAEDEDAPVPAHSSRPSSPHTPASSSPSLPSSPPVFHSSYPLPPSNPQTMSLKRKAADAATDAAKKTKPNSSITSFFGAPKPKVVDFNKDEWVAKLTPEQKELLTLEINTLHESWLPHLKDVLTSPAFLSLKRFLKQELASGKTIYPPMKDVYSW